MRLKYPLFICLLLGLWPALWSQPGNIQFEHLTTSDGLPNVSVGSIVQDHDGFIWFGTIDGLTRYDGFDMVTFRNIPEDSTSLSNNEIWALAVDSTHHMWVGTRGGGLNKYNPRTETFKSYLFEPDEPHSISSDIIRSIFIDSKRRLWLGTYRGLCQYDYELDSFVQYIQEDIEPGGNTIHDMVEDEQGQIWLATMGGGVQIFNPESETFAELSEVLGAEFSLRNRSIVSICIDRYGDTWFGTTNGIERIRTQGGKVAELRSYTQGAIGKEPVVGGAVYQIHEDQQGRLWFGTDNGFLQYDREADEFIQHIHHDLHQKSLSDNQVWLVYEDRDENLWLGTQWGGVNLYKPGRDLIEQYSYNSFNNNGLSNRVVQSAIQDQDGIIWLGIDHGGLNRFDREKNEFKHFRHDPNNPESLSSDPVLTVKDDGNSLLIGTWDGGFGIFDKETELFRRIYTDPDDPNSICNGIVHGLLKDSKGDIWVGTYNCGAYRIEAHTGHITHYAPDSENPRSISSGRVWTIVEDSDNRIWLGTNNGLSRYESASNDFTVYQTRANDSTSLSNNAIRAIYEDTHQTLWFGTSRGLNRFDPVNDGFVRYTSRNGLPGDVISSITEDSKGNLWLGTFSGICKLNPVSGEVFTLSVKNGLVSNQIRYRSSCRLHSGELLFGSPRGFVIFHPDSVRPISNQSNLVFTDLLINNQTMSPGVPFKGKKILENSINQTASIRLPYRFNDLALRVASIDFQSPTNNLHAYKFEDEDEDWIQLGNRRWINFNNLKPGAYNLMVKGSNSNQDWKSPIKSIRIIIDPPLWKTWYALLFYLIFGLSFLTFLLVTIIKKERLTKRLEMRELVAQQEQQLNDIKMRFYTNVTHEFRTPLSLIIAPLCDLINRTAELNLPEEYSRKLTIINSNAQRLLTLVNQLIDFRKTEFGLMKLKVSQCFISDLVNEISHSFEELARLSQIQFQVIDELEEKVIWCEPGKIEMVLNNLLSNSIRFAPTGGFVRIRLKDSEDYVGISVEDNGPGIQEKELEKIFERFYQGEGDVSVATSGIGLALSQKLVELHKGEISVTSIPKKLTRFTIKLRKGKAHFEPGEMVIQTSEADYDIQDTRRTWKQSSEHAPDQGTHSNKLILVVDDNTELRNYMSGLLSQHYQVIVASDGIEAWEKIETDNPDMVISDVLMPRLDGYELCQKIKSNEISSHIPVILVTAKYQDRFRFLGIQQGADDFISKPFDPVYLLEKVHQLIKSRDHLESKFSRKVVLAPTNVLIKPADEILIEKAKKIVEQNMSNPDFETHKLASEMGMSYSTLYRKLNPLIQATPAEFIRDMRLSRAAQLLGDDNRTILEIALECGFQDLKTFRSWFEKKYGSTPSAFRKS